MPLSINLLVKSRRRYSVWCTRGRSSSCLLRNQKYSVELLDHWNEDDTPLRGLQSGNEVQIFQIENTSWLTVCKSGFRRRADLLYY